MALEIRKKAHKNFEHVYNTWKLTFSDLRIAFNGETQNVLITRENGAFVIKREGFNVTEISVYDETGAGTEETFVNVTVLANRLIELGYIAFYTDNDIVIADLISNDAGNSLTIGTDGLLYVPAGGSTPIPTENQIEFKIQEATVSGTFELDIDTYSDFYLTMTAATELSFKAGTLPALGFGKRFKIVLTGAFAQTWADAYMNSFGDNYDGTKLNDVLCEVAHLAAGYRGEAINQQRETA